MSEEGRQAIRIEIGNGDGIRGIGLMPGRNASTVSREIRRNTWFPSDENESYRPKRLKTAPWTGGYYIAGPAQRKADRRQAPPRGSRAAHPRQGVDERVAAASPRCRAGAATDARPS
nr:helix-turn-helix domain-containing protein [Bifidobacterium bifidum]